MPTPDHENRSLISSPRKDPSKLFLNECRFSVALTESTRQTFKVSGNARNLCEDNTSSKEMMCSLLQATFLNGTDLTNYMNIVIRIA